jgi:hypothetical protein
MLLPTVKQVNPQALSSLQHAIAHLTIAATYFSSRGHLQHEAAAEDIMDDLARLMKETAR